jgi:hypothetical protein
MYPNYMDSTDTDLVYTRVVALELIDCHPKEEPKVKD